ncbi:MAG: hypothetical protein KGJ86_17475, partial [Chloroflexota bacterium]|nr:hypothetical protein [Chloroflexota bacterium]
SKDHRDHQRRYRMGQRADAIEHEIVATREEMSRTIDLMERQLRRSMDWKTKVAANPWPYVVGALALGFILAGGPRRTAGAVAQLWPRRKSRLERLLEGLPEPIAERLAPPARDRLEDVRELPKQLQKQVREIQRERERRTQREDEERLRKAARATMLERIALKAAEAVGTAVAAAAVKQLLGRLDSKD